MEFGRSNSDRYLLVYDKDFHLRMSAIAGYNNTAGADSRRARPLLRRTRTRTRFELRLKDTGPLANLQSISNPFSRYTVKEFRQLEQSLCGFQLAHFLDSCRLRGMQSALSLITDRRTRARYAAAVREVDPPEWWGSEELWTERHQAFGEVFGLQASEWQAIVST